jgi:hypothetical protein
MIANKSTPNVKSIISGDIDKPDTGKQVEKRVVSSENTVHGK